MNITIPPRIKKYPDLIWFSLLLFTIFYCFNTNYAILYWISISSFLWFVYGNSIKLIITWISFIFMLSHIIVNYYSIDNHQYLLCWITLLYGLKLLRQDINLVFLARFTFAILFFSAATWKIQTHEFRDGTFLVSSFASYQKVLPNIISNLYFKPNKLEIIRQIEKIKNGDIDRYKISISPIILALAKPLSIFTILIEYLISFLFAFNFLKAANLFLITFLLSTYFIIPVFSFAQCLCLLAFLAFNKKETSHTQFFYIFYILFLPLTGFIS